MRRGGTFRAMSPDSLVFVFDYTDPLSYLVERGLRRASESAAVPPVRRLGLEAAPPPAPLLSPLNLEWKERWAACCGELKAAGQEPEPPVIVPWTRKAHELRLFAVIHGQADDMHRALFDAFFLEGKDLGRVDVLVRLALDLGLDYGEVKAVLDIDKFTAGVEEERAEARGLQVGSTPVLLRGRDRLEGWPGQAALQTFLRIPASG